MLNRGQRAATERPVSSEGGPTFGLVLGLACQAAIAAFQAIPLSEAGDTADSRTDANDVAVATPHSRDPGAVRYLAALVIAAALVFTWIILRSL